mmetsp:Transcript_11075/g.50192  ORF Transcript_11075/g.50192 Transcript_11075/m.50192 type:complete len:339 (-) Transcript_11075:226-1242(-)
MGLRTLSRRRRRRGEARSDGRRLASLRRRADASLVRAPAPAARRVRPPPQLQAVGTVPGGVADDGGRRRTCPGHVHEGRVRATLPGVHVLAGSVAYRRRAGVRRVRPQSVRGPRRGVRTDHGRDNRVISSLLFRARGVAGHRRALVRVAPRAARARLFHGGPRGPSRVGARDQGGDDGLVRAVGAVRPGDAVVDERAAFWPVRRVGDRAVVCSRRRDGARSVSGASSRSASSFPQWGGVPVIPARSTRPEPVPHADIERGVETADDVRKTRRNKGVERVERRMRPRALVRRDQLADAGEEGAGRQRVVLRDAVRVRGVGRDGRRGPGVPRRPGRRRRR